MATSNQNTSFAKTRAETGYRSQSEVKVSEVVDLLAGKKGGALYEKATLPFSYMVNRRYTPDFIIPDKAMVLEIKGMFSPSDRTKMLIVKRQYPDLDIRLVFDNPNARLNRTSKTSYASWAEKSGFLWCATKEFPPEDWRNHKPSKKQKEAFASAVHINK